MTGRVWKFKYREFKKKVKGLLDFKKLYSLNVNFTNGVNLT